MDSATATRTTEAEPTIQSSYDWPSAEAGWLAARDADTKACRDRMNAAMAVSKTREGSERSNWPAIAKDPTVAPLCAAEDAAHAAAYTALEALMRTPAPDWRAWAVKLGIAREYADELLSPFCTREPAAYRKQDKDYPGSLLCAELSHHALAAHAGILPAELLATIPSRFIKVAAKADVRLGAADATEIDEIGFDALLQDARRLVKQEPTPPAPLASTLPNSRFDAWAAERDRLYTEAAGIEDVPGTPNLEANLARQAELDRRGDHYENLIRNTPCDSAEAALGKLNWIGEAFKSGDTGDEQRVLEQVIAYLSGEAPRVHPDQEILDCVETYRRNANVSDHIVNNAIGADPKGDDKVLYDAAKAAMEEALDRLKALRATTLDGARAKAFVAVYWECQDDFDGYEAGDSVAARILAHDLIGLPVNMTAKEHCDWAVANGWFPGDDFKVERSAA